MSKAYDRVEWQFVEATMRKMGFGERWIGWIMKCIKSVVYKVLINGQPRGKITPNRGLRQGDPLSPYIFILCTEVLISNLKRAESVKSLTGLKVARASPPVSHLLFADDSLFFCKASVEESAVLLQILQNYERASGQKINFDKSSIQFGHTVETTVRAEIHQMLGIHKVGGVGNYLGVPESLGGAKTKIFSFLIDRQQKRINGWTSKVLSKGGKEVMVKSVLSAMPTHVMSCFRLPKGVTNKLTSAVANFWWSTNSQTRGMHWLAWRKLCRHKTDGGLGFRVIEDFNTALLAKQLWRLMDNPDSLFAKVFKGRYFRNSTPLDPIRSYSPSYGWQSIVSARPLVCKGLIKRVGSGSSISVWYDPWISDSCPRPAICKGINYYPHLTVNQLINSQTSTWNRPLLQQFFESEEITRITGIPVATGYKPDTWGWFYTTTGRYTVKSGYTVLQELSDEGTLPVFGPDTRRLQAQSWKVKCTTKLQHFLWQIITGCLSVGARLCSRGMRVDPLCVRCGMGDETINHMLFECPPARQAWALSPIPTPPQFFPTGALYSNMAHLFWNLPDNDDMLMYPWLLWFIWKARNYKVFSNDDQNPQEVMESAITESRAWVAAQTVADGVSNSISINSGHVPPGEWCQIDGAWKVTDSRAGLGWYNFDPDSGSVLMGSSNLRRGLSPLQTELEALVWAMQSMLVHNKRRMNFQTDSAQLVKMVSKPAEWPAFAILLEEVEHCRGMFQAFSLTYIPRTKNTRADKLARSARAQPHDVYYINSVPPIPLPGPV
ncbi:unnamed protein product [Microthlaspi erraticum]|nr:unnamed protein product [Microthlaspi erraticum]